MNLKNQLLEDASKANIIYISSYIVENGDIDNVWNCILDSDALIAARAARVIDYIAEKRPELFEPYASKAVDLLLINNNNNGVRRCILRAIDFSKVPTEQHGKLIDICFNYLLSVKEPVANRALSMEILYSLTKGIPELQEELKLTIEQGWSTGSAGFKSKGRKIISAINNEK